MKVKELIETLQKMPQDVDVLRYEPGHYDDYYHQPADGVDVREVLAPDSDEAYQLTGKMVVVIR